MPISLYGRNSVSGTYAYFKEHALLKGDFKDMVKEQPGLGRSGKRRGKRQGGRRLSGHRIQDLRCPRRSAGKNAESPMIEANFAMALEGRYPLGRSLYIYVAKKPNEPLPPQVKEFLKFVLSKEGQKIVINAVSALCP